MLVLDCVCCDGVHTHKSLVTIYTFYTIYRISSVICCCYLWRCILFTYLLHTAQSACNIKDAYPKQKQKFLLFLLKHMQVQMKFQSMINNRKICIWIFHSVISSDSLSTLRIFKDLLWWLGRQFRSNTLEQTYAIEANVKCKVQKLTSYGKN